MEKIKPVKKLYGTVTMPGDKSISHRSVMIGSIAQGETRVKGLLDCDDCSFTIKAFREMGISIEQKGRLTVIEGRGLKGLKKPKGELNVGNSGTTMRLMSGILAGQDFEATLTGDASLSKRPMRRIVEPLSLMDVDIKARDGEYPPIIVKGGKVKPITYKMPVHSAQVKSAILLAGLYADGITVVEEGFKSRDHTERMLKFFGSRIKAERLEVSLKGGRELIGKNIEIPGDVSSASFFIVGATLLKGSKIRIDKVGVNPTRAGILKILSRMGGKIKILNKKNSSEPVADIEVKSNGTHGIVIDEDLIPSVIDELPVIFVLAALSKGRTVIKGARELKVKETDRIHSMRENLLMMGARVEALDDDIVIEGARRLKGANLKSFGDHRTCMALAIAALAADGESTIDDVECVNKSFPGFFKILNHLKA